MTTDTLQVDPGTGPESASGADHGSGAGSDHGHRHLGLALVLISVAQLMVVLDSTIANIAVPYISEELDFSASSQSWIITGYALAFGGLLLLGGRLGDLYGRRKIFMVGVSIFAVASLLGGVAQNPEMLLASRALQGLGAAIASPTALALITTTFPAGPQRNRAFAVYAAMSGAGAAVGLILGGWLTEFSWRWTFLINVPIGIAAAVAAPMILAESKRHKGALDLPGALTGTLGLLSLVYGLTRAAVPQHGWDDPLTIAAIVAGVVLLLAFVTIERFVRQPLMPFRILANRNRGTSFAVMMLVPAAMFSMFYFLSLFVQNVMGYSSLRTGFAFLPFSFGIVISAMIASKLMSHVDPRWLAGMGTTLAGLGLFGFSRLPYNDEITNLAVDAHYATDILPWVLVMSFGMGFVFVPLTLTAVHGVGDADSGIGSGVLNAMQQVGGALGLATLSTVAVHASTDKAGSLGRAAQGLSQGGTSNPDQQAALMRSVQDVAYTYGATNAFLVGAGMIWLGTVIAVIFMNVKHEEITAGGPETLPSEAAARETVPTG